MSEWPDGEQLNCWIEESLCQAADAVQKVSQENVVPRSMEIFAIPLFGLEIFRMRLSREMHKYMKGNNPPRPPFHG